MSISNPYPSKPIPIMYPKAAFSGDEVLGKQTCCKKSEYCKSCGHCIEYSALCADTEIIGLSVLCELDAPCSRFMRKKSEERK